MFDISIIGAAAFLLARREDGAFVYDGFNAAVERLTGLRSADVLGRTVAEVFGPEVGQTVGALQQRCAETRSQVEYETPAKVPLGDLIYSTTLTPIIPPEGAVSTIFGVTVDVTARRNLEAELRISNLRLNLAMKALGGAHWFFDPERRTFELSPAFETLLGSAVPQVMTIDQWQQHVLEEDRDDTCFADLLAGRADQGTAEFRVRSASGDTRWVRCRRQSLSDRSGVIGIAGVVVDITSEKRQERDLSLQATSDALTSLANRRRFDEVLAATAQDSDLALLMIDVDHFKAYNDTYGHVGGDLALKQVAAILDRAASLNGGLAARYGGEEFAIILRNAHRTSAVDTAVAILDELKRLDLPHSGSATGRVSVSIGVATNEGAGAHKPTTLVALADQALYKAKAAGRGCYRVSDVGGDRKAA